MESRKQRADSLIGEVNWACCRFAAFVIYNNKENNHKGAAGWHKQGTVTKDPYTADVITNGTHVGVIIKVGKEIYVYHSPGEGKNKPIKAYSYQDFITYVMPNGTLRKL